MGAMNGQTARRRLIASGVPQFFRARRGARGESRSTQPGSHVPSPRFADVLAKNHGEIHHGARFRAVAQRAEDLILARRISTSGLAVDCAGIEQGRRINRLSTDDRAQPF